ncbi:helix-turn-helix domain-containing protein, partial [Bordetella pertussis]|uniref:helix-turn-helix domain-containing protein n=1 Tax=Bordetella pertussis TaxID=520 RepID=UPI000B2158CA
MKKFSDRLKHARRLRQLSQENLAHISGLSQSAVASYENGLRQSSRSIRKLAIALQVNLDWFETGVGPMELEAYPSGPAAWRPGLMEPGGERAAAPWPFRAVAHARYQALSARDKLLLEQLVRTFIDACHPPPASPRRRAASVDPPRPPSRGWRRGP